MVFLWLTLNGMNIRLINAHILGMIKSLEEKTTRRSYDIDEPIEFSHAYEHKG